MTHLSVSLRVCVENERTREIPEHRNAKGSLVRLPQPDFLRAFSLLRSERGHNPIQI